MLMKPKQLQRGDKIATVSLSWGGAGEENLRWRYRQGVKRLEEVFGLEVIAMPNSLKGEAYLYEHPEARAADLMDAFRDERIKAIIANIGGDDSIRLLPHIDFTLIRDNPKIFMGYSDTTITHLFCHKAGIVSFYGPSVLTDFAENVAMDAYTIEMVERTLFTTDVIGKIKAAEKWTSEYIPWEEKNKDLVRKRETNSGYEVIQGTGTVVGELIGGCIEVLEFAKGTVLWPEETYWENSILFFETSEDKPTPEYLKGWLRNYGAQGILQKANGIIFGKPQDEAYAEEYKDVIKQVMKEYHLEDVPVMCHMNFGHTEPKMILPYGARAAINCDEVSFTILDSAVK